jgi:hypothetical protein
VAAAVVECGSDSRNDNQLDEEISLRNAKKSENFSESRDNAVSGDVKRFLHSHLQRELLLVLGNFFFPKANEATHNNEAQK